MDRVDRADRRAPHHQLRPRRRPQPRPARRAGSTKVAQDRWTRSTSSLDEVDGAAHQATASSSTACSGTGVITTEDALDFGFTGPCLRACGVDYDVRKAQPVLGLRPARLRRAVGHERRQLRPLPAAHRGDEAVRSHHPPGARRRCPPGPVIVDDRRIALPPKPEVYSTIEGVIAHFKLVMEGIQVPPGEVYDYTEARQRRARLVPRQRRQRPALQGPRARAGLPHPLGRAADDRGQDAGGPDPDLRHDQHDRRRGRAVSDDDKKPTTRSASARHPGDDGPEPPPARAPADSPPPAAASGAAEAAPKNPGFVTCTIDGKEVVVKPGTNMIEAAKQVGVDIPYYCYHPRLSHRGQLPHVPGRGRPTRPSWCPPARRALAEGMAIKTTTPKVKEQPARGDGVPAAQPPGRLPHLRPGRRVQAAGLLHAVRPPALAARGRQGPARTSARCSGRMVVLDQERCILCTRCVRFMDEVAEGAAAGRVRPRHRTSVIDVVPGQRARLQLLGQHRGHLPGGRAAQPRLPLPRARVVPLRGAVGLHRLLARLQHLRGLHRAGHLPLPPARERADQQELDVRPGPALLQVPEQGPRAAARVLGRGADAREATPRRGGEGRGRASSSRWPARRGWRCSPRRWPRTRTCSRAWRSPRTCSGVKTVYVGGPARGRRRTTS